MFEKKKMTLSKDGGGDVYAISESEQLINHRLGPVFSELSRYKSLPSLLDSGFYQTIKQGLEEVIYGYEYAVYSEEKTLPEKPFYRVVEWNLDFGQNYEGILDILKNHPLISQADIYLFPALDIGMARTKNQNIARSLALELGYNYFFVTSYINLTSFQKNHRDQHAQLSKQQCLEGNVIMSRYPLSHFKIVSLKNCKDPMTRREKRLGAEKAVFAELGSGKQKIVFACVNLDKYSSQKQRALQMKQIMDYAKQEFANTPVIISGDLKTSGFNTSNSASLLLSAFNKVFRGIDYILEEHLPHPEKHFERNLFQIVEQSGFDYKNFNDLGKGTLHYKKEEMGRYEFLGYVTSQKLLQMMQKTLAKHGGKASLQLDWFLANAHVKPSSYLQAEKPKVISNLYYNGNPVSTHDAILLDFEIVP